MVAQQSRLDYLKSTGVDIVQHCLRPECAQTPDASDPLDVTLKDGFYEIRQMGQSADEAVAVQAGTGTERPVIMRSTSILPPPSWRLTGQYGVDKGYTIVPEKLIPQEPSGVTPLGTTTADTCCSAVVRLSRCFPVWMVRCDEKITYRDPQGNIITEEYFRIIELGTNNCWRSNGDSQQVIISQMSYGPNGRPDNAELFTFLSAEPNPRT